MLTPNLMPGSVCIVQGNPVSFQVPVSLEVWMEFYWIVRSYNISGSAGVSGFGFSITDVYSGEPGLATPPVTMRSFMCQFFGGGLPYLPPNPPIHTAGSGMRTFDYPSAPPPFDEPFSVSIVPARGFRNQDNYYISVNLSNDVPYFIGAPIVFGSITFNLSSGSFSLPVGTGSSEISGFCNLIATPASLNTPE